MQAPPGDVEVVARHLAGDPIAFGILVDRYEKSLVSFVSGAIGDSDRASDLVQEVFVRVFRHLRWFDQHERFSVRIYGIAAALAKSELQHRHSGAREAEKGMIPW
ncbi:MAG TPA: sigma factor [Gemmatimonadales bacterium]|nr:sigma factor [Gemmatimonadales bacterium]